MCFLGIGRNLNQDFTDEDATVDAPFTPEIFMREVEERRLRTAGMVKSHAQRARLLRRRGEIGSEMSG